MTYNIPKLLVCNRLYIYKSVTSVLYSFVFVKKYFHSVTYSITQARKNHQRLTWNVHCLKGHELLQGFRDTTQNSS